MDDGILIPETCGDPRYRKGPYDADQGAFVIAGSADMATVEALARPLLKLEYGGASSDRYGRLLWAQTPAAGLTCALEATHSYRPWNEFWPSSKINGFLRLAPEMPGRDWTFTALATEERGDGGSPPPDRPLPANHEEDFDDLRLGNGYHFQRAFLGLQRIEDRPGGVTDRYRIHAGVSTMRNWVNPTYAMQYKLEGDQKELLDRRGFLGGEASRQWASQGDNISWVHSLGMQGRLDLLDAAKVFATQRGERWKPLMEARGELLHGALHGQSTARWGQGWRGFLAGRVDTQRNQVYGAMPWTRQDRLATLVSPRLGLGWSPREDLDLRASVGQGFRLGNAFRDTRPMIRAHSAELGAQTRILGPWASGLTFWRLELEHESLWDAQEGAPTLRGPSRRQGLEWFNGFTWGSWSGEACLGWSRARFLEAPAGLDRVPGSIPQTAVLSLGWEAGPMAVGLTFKSLGAYALTPDNLIVSGRRTALELRLKRTWRDWSAALKVINAFNLRKNDQAYFYESRLPGEAGSVADTHTKHGDPQAIRIEVSHRF
jgi:hypothetical protein